MKLDVADTFLADNKILSSTMDSIWVLVALIISVARKGNNIFYLIQSHWYNQERSTIYPDFPRF